MIKIRLLQSRFRGVYLGLGIIWAAATLGISVLFDSRVVPHLLLSKVESVEALVKSHEAALQFYDDRALRDSLLRSGVIVHDQDFEQLRPSKKADQAVLSELLHSCRFLTEKTCVAPQSALILSAAGAHAPLQSSFVIRLKTNTFSEIPGIIFWKILSALGFGLLIGMIIWAVRQQEKFLLKKIGLLIQSFSQVESIFKKDMGPATTVPNNNSTQSDEFVALSQGIKQVGDLLTVRTQQIKEYKGQFEQRARIEQLAQTITYSSHELKAPLHEGADFLRDLPEFLDSMPRDLILKSAKSLEKRLRDGAISLQEALQTTKNAQYRPERTNLASLLQSFVRRVTENPELKRANVCVDTSKVEQAFILCDHPELEAAFYNLYRNATEARRDCQVKIVGRISGKSAVIEFTDDGPGIPDLLLPQVFDEFFTTKLSGSGLGLSIVKQAISRAQGEIRAIPSLAGAHFEIVFPLIESPLKPKFESLQERGSYAQA